MKSISHGNRSKTVREQKKIRLFKVLDYDSSLTLKQLSERFGITTQAVHNYKKEWKELNS